MFLLPVKHFHKTRVVSFLQFNYFLIGTDSLLYSAVSGLMSQSCNATGAHVSPQKHSGKVRSLFCTYTPELCCCNPLSSLSIITHRAHSSCPVLLCFFCCRGHQGFILQWFVLIPPAFTRVPPPGFRKPSECKSMLITLLVSTEDSTALREYAVHCNTG